MATDDLVHVRNMEFFSSLIPTIFYLVLLMVVGLVGNTIVFLVYYKKFKPSITRTYILAMSVCDLHSNVLALPSDIVEMRYYYSYYDDGSCKFFGFVTRMLALYAVCLLVAIAVDRQRAICRPMKKQKLVKHVYIELACFGAFAALSSIPFGILRGLQTIDIDNTANMTGTTCSIDDYYIEGKLFSIYNSLNGLLFIICITIMGVAYGLIGRHLWLHKKRFNKKTSKKPGPGQGLPQTLRHDQKQAGLEPQPGIQFGSLQGNQSVNASTTSLIHEKPNGDQSVENQSQGASRSAETCLVRTAILNNTSLTLGTNGGSAKATREQEGDPEDGISLKILSIKTLQTDLKLGDTSDVVTTSADETDEDTIETETVGMSTDDSVTESSSSTSGLKGQPGLKGHPKPAKKQRSTKSKKITKTTAKKIPGRTTLMMFVLTACFVVSYLPYLIMAAVFKGRDLREESYWLWNMHQIALRSFFINSAVNPLVYSFCSVKFRQECYRFLCRK